MLGRLLKSSALAVCLLTSAAAGSTTSGDEAVTGTVFLDRDGDGLRGRQEPALAGVVVSNQQVVATSGEDGSYRLPGPGYGIVFVSLPSARTAPHGFWRAAGRIGVHLRPRLRPPHQPGEPPPAATAVGDAPRDRA